MDNKSNLAYDYKRLEQKKKAKCTNVKMVENKKAHHILAKAICTMSVVVIMLSALIYTRVIQSEVSLDYNAAVKELNTLKGENSRLQIITEKKFSADNIEQIAENDLNMSQLDNSRIEYIKFNNQDKAKVIRKQSFFDTVQAWFWGLFN